MVAIRMPLKFKIFAVVFSIQLIVISIFIYSFVKTFKEEKLTSAFEANASAISEIKSRFESKIFLMIEKIKSTTALVEKNQLAKENVVGSLDLENEKTVEALFHYEVETVPGAEMKLTEKFSRSPAPDLTKYFSQINQQAGEQFPYFWKFDWQNKEFVGMAFNLQFNIDVGGVTTVKKHLFYLLFNQKELFQVSNKNQLAETVIFTSAGQTLYSSAQLEDESLKSVFEGSFFKNALQNRNIIQVSEQVIQQRKYLVSVQANSFGSVLVSTFISTEAAFAGIKKVYANAFYLTALSIIFSYLFTLLFSSTITKPLRDLTTQMQRVSKGELDVVVQVKSKDEVGALAVNFNQMAIDLKSSKEALENLNKDLENKVAERTAQLEELTIKDALTGAYNRRYFDQRVAEEIKRADRSGKSLGLLYLDIDHFKKYNDQNGHPEGDQLLINFVKVVKGITRTNDFFCRLGGEEFCIITVNADSEGIKILSEKVRNEVYTTDFKFGEKQPMGRLSCSIGVSLYPDFCFDADSLVKSADEALYHAKQGGRNRWVLAEKPITRQVDEILTELHKTKAS